MKPSIIIVVEDRDISVHPNLEHAASFLEPVDVRDSIYTAYDSEGNLLDLLVTVVERQHSVLIFKWTKQSEVIKIKLHHPLENREGELRNKLLRYLGNVGDKEVQDQLSTKDLIQLVGKYMPWRING